MELEVSDKVVQSFVPVKESYPSSIPVQHVNNPSYPARYLLLRERYHMPHILPRRSCACQNGPGPGRVNSFISNEVRRAIDFHQ